MGWKRSVVLSGGRLFSFLISFALQGLFGLSLILSMFGKMIVRYLYQTFSFDRTIYVRLLNLTEPTIYLLLFVSLVLLYYTFQMLKFQNLDMYCQGRPLLLLSCMRSWISFGNMMDRYVSHFLDARFFGSVVLAVIMFWFILVAKIMIIGCILNASIQFAREAKFQTRSGEIVSKLKSEEVDFRHREVSQKLKRRLRLIKKKKRNKESGTEIGHSLEFDFVVPPSAQLSRAVKADGISVVEPTQPLRLARQFKNNWEARILSQPLFFIYFYCICNKMCYSIVNRKGGVRWVFCVRSASLRELWIL